MRQHLSTAAKPIIGRSLTDIERVDSSMVLLKFKDGDQCQMSVEGDCCSHSVFYEIVFPKKCRGSEIIHLDSGATGENEEKAVAKATHDKTLEWSPEENQVFDVLFATRAGEIRVRHINSSNGYYGGMVMFGEMEPQPQPKQN